MRSPDRNFDFGGKKREKVVGQWDTGTVWDSNKNIKPVFFNGLGGSPKVGCNNL